MRRKPSLHTVGVSAVLAVSSIIGCILGLDALTTPGDQTDLFGMNDKQWFMIGFATAIMWSLLLGFDLAKWTYKDLFLALEDEEVK